MLSVPRSKATAKRSPYGPGRRVAKSAATNRMYKTYHFSSSRRTSRRRPGACGTLPTDVRRHGERARTREAAFPTRAPRLASAGAARLGPLRLGELGLHDHGAAGVPD